MPQSGQMSDGESVAYCLAHLGERQALASLVQRYSKLVFYTVRWTCSHYGCPCADSEVEDLYQETFLSVFTNDCRVLRTYDPSQGRLSTLLGSIARNKTINWLKTRRAPAPRDADELEAAAAAPDSALEHEERRCLLEKALTRLSDRDRLFYQLYYRDQLPVETIAELLGIGRDTVYSKKAKLAEALRGAVASASAAGLGSQGGRSMADGPNSSR